MLNTAHAFIPAQWKADLDMEKFLTLDRINFEQKLKTFTSNFAPNCSTLLSFNAAAMDYQSFSLANCHLDRVCRCRECLCARFSGGKLCERASRKERKEIKFYSTEIEKIEIIASTSGCCHLKL